MAATQQMTIRMTVDASAVTAGSSDVMREIGRLGDALSRFSREASDTQQKIKDSAVQSTAAIRSLIVDSIKSLQDGKFPLTALIEQGGQLKDMFGGVGPAAKAVGGYVAALATPFNLAASAVAALGVAYFLGKKEATDYANALILTGNAVGQSKGQLQDMAVAISKTNGSQDQAAEALLALVRSGKVAGGSLFEVGDAAVAMSRVLGVSIDESVAQIGRLGDEPTKASAKLNESLHYLTQATYEHIKSLEDQGEKEQAAALAQTTHSMAMKQRTAEVKENLGSMERAWKALGDVVRGTWDAMKGVGRPSTLADQKSDLERQLTDARKSRSMSASERRVMGSNPEFMTIPDSSDQNSSDQNIKVIENRIRVLDGFMKVEAAASKVIAENVAVQDKAIAVTDGVGAWQVKANGISAVTRELKKYHDNLDLIRRASPQSPLLLPEAIKAGEDAIRDAYAQKKPQAQAYSDDAATKYLEQLRQTQAVLVAQVNGEEKISDAQKEQAKFQQLLADLKEKKILTTDQKSLLAKADVIQVQLRENALSEELVEIRKREVKEEEKKRSLREDFAKNAASLNATMSSANQGKREQYAASLSTAGLSSFERQKVEAQQAIYKEYGQNMRSWSDKASAAKQPLDSPEYKEEVSRIKESLEESLADHAAYYEQLRRNRDDWSLGVRGALSNYVEDSENSFKLAGGVIERSFKGAEDALLNFATKGKLDVRGLAESIISDLARVAIQQTITGPLAKGLLGIFGGGGYSAADQAGMDGLIMGILTRNAKGGVYDSSSLSSYSSGVYDSPQFFAFEKGGVFAEAGPEAIMPLRRGSDGRLGVSAPGGASAAPAIQFAPSNVFHIDARSDRGAVMADMQRLLAENNRGQMEQLKRVKVLPQ